MKMFKKLTRIWLFIALCMTLALANEKFQTLKEPVKDEQNSVIEVFSFWCGGCYHHHTLGTLARVKEKLPNLKYKIYPFTRVQYGEEYAKLYAYAQNKDEAAQMDATQKDSSMYKLADAYFVALFKRKQNFANSQAFTELGLKTLGITQKELNDFIKSSQGQRIYKEYDKANAITKERSVTPSFTVNGKYSILLEEIQGLDDFIATIQTLSQK